MIAWALVLAACGGGEPAAPSRPADVANVAPAKVTEVVACGEATVIHVVEAEWDFFVATPATGLRVDDYVWMGKGPAVSQKVCGERTFDEVLAIDAVTVATPEEVGAFVKLAPAEGGQSIAELHNKKGELAGKPVKVRGRVTKISEAVFGTNWIHLADGTGEGATGDFTVNSLTPVKVGDVVVAEGPLVADLDLGFGYFYPVIIQESVITVEAR